jgi:hypothetical protein
MHVCSQPGCPELTTARRCDDHATQYERARGTRQQRGYDTAHERLRKQWQHKVEQGGVHCMAKVCLMPARLILLGQPWHLDHNDDRTGYRGPAHERCNTSAGGKAAHAR